MRHIKSILIVFVLVFLFVPSFVCAVDIDSSKFNEAGIAYKNEKYANAIDLYEGIIEEGSISGNIYYNLGNCYFKIGRIGKAILNYERARKYIPLDSGLKANYKFVSSLVKRTANAKQNNFVESFIKGYADSLTINTVAGVCLVLYVITGCFVFLGLFLKIPKRMMANISIVLLAVMLFNTFIFFWKISAQSDKAIIVKFSESRFEPTDNATVYFELNEGLKVEVIKIEGDWAKIKRSDGKMGWALLSCLEKI